MNTLGLRCSVNWIITCMLSPKKDRGLQESDCDASSSGEGRCASNDPNGLPELSKNYYDNMFQLYNTVSITQSAHDDYGVNQYWLYALNGLKFESFICCL